MGEFVKVAKTQDLPPGRGMCVEAGGERVALFNVDGAFYAIGDTCTHAGGPLSEGELAGKVVTCPWHGATFDVTSGAVLTRPAASGVQCYQVQVEGDDIKVRCP